MRKIYSLKVEESGNMEDHIQEMMTLFEKLNALNDNDKLSDQWVVGMLLSSLSKRYATFITALDTRTKGDLTVELVQSK